jgi:hypothetical protein
MEIKQIYDCQEVLMRAGELQTDKEKECDKLFKDPRTRELIVEEEERLKNMKDNLEQEIVKTPHCVAVNEANNKILAAIDYDKLVQEHRPDIIEKAVNTMCSHAGTFQEGDLKKLATSHEIYSEPHDHTSQEIDAAGLCLVIGMCHHI